MKDSTTQIFYIGMEHSIGSNFCEDMELSKYHIFEHFFYWHRGLHEVKFIKNYGVLKIINSIKPSMMQGFFFYNGVLHETRFINDCGVLKQITINKLHVALFCKCMECSMAYYLLKGMDIFPSKKSIELFFSVLIWST